MAREAYQRIIVASCNARRRALLCRKLAEFLPLAEVVALPSIESIAPQIQASPTDCVVIDTEKNDATTDPDAIIGELSRLRPSLHMIWLLPKPVDGIQWLARTRAHAVDFMVLPVAPLELAQRCCGPRRQRPGSAAPRTTVARTDLLRQRSIDLHESDERYRLLFGTISDGIVVLRLDSKRHNLAFVDVNHHFCRMLGYPREELLALRPRDLVEPFRIAFVNARLESIVDYRRIFFETVLVARDGRYVPVGMTARLFSYRGQSRIIAIAHPLRPRANPPLPTHTQGKPTSSAAQSGQMMYEYNIRTRELRIEGAVRQITGRNAEELVATPLPALLQLIQEEDRRDVLAEFAHAASELCPYNLRYRIKHASGEIRHLEDSGVVLPNKSGMAGVCLGSVMDISHQVRGEKEHLVAEKDLQHSKRLESLGVLAGGIAHDFNNILSAIIGLTDLSIEALEGADPEILEDLSESLGAAHRAKDLVRQILAFSRQSSEEHKPLYLHTVVREVLGLLRASLPPSIRIVERLDPKSGMVMANATQMHQVVMNYCTNGLQAMSEKGGDLHVKVENTYVTHRFAAIHPKLEEGTYIKLTVSDRGHGMARSVVQRIFDPFYTTKGPGEGAGMGLAMVHGIVANHGGTILVESAVGKGTQIHTYFPRVEPVASAIEAPPGKAKPGKERILIVDDERTVLRFCERALTRLGYQVHTLGSPEEALNHIKEDPNAYDVIMTDYHMPGMTGVGLARRIHRLRRDLPMLLFTGFSLDVDEREASRVGIREIVNKPVVVTELTDALRRVIDEQNPPDKKHH